MSLIIQSIAAISSATLVSLFIGFVVGYIASDSLTFFANFDAKVDRIMRYTIIIGIIGLLIATGICVFIAYREQRSIMLRNAAAPTCNGPLTSTAPSPSPTAAHNQGFGIQGGIAGGIAVGPASSFHSSFAPQQYEPVSPTAQQQQQQHQQQQQQQQQAPIIRYY